MSSDPRHTGLAAPLLSVLRPVLLPALAFALLLLQLAACGVANADVAPPTIARAPQTAAVPQGATATFSVEVEGAGPLAFEWQRDGVPINGAHDAHYTTAPVSRGGPPAQYRVLVRNPGGVASSAPVLLRVL